MFPTEEDFALVQVIFDDLVRKVCGYTVPRSVARARGILDRALTCSMSLQRQDFESDDEDSGSEHIGSDEVAERLGVTRRTVQRNAEAYGGQLISGVYVFPDEIGAESG